MPALAGGTISESLIDNGTFDPDISRALDPWEVKNGTGEKVLCVPKAPATTDGTCAFRFKGSAGEAGKLVQKASSTILVDVNNLLLSSNGIISFAYRYYSESDASQIDAKIVVVHTPDGGIKTKSKMTDPASGSTQSGPEYIWAVEGPIGTIQLSQNTTVHKVKVQFKNSSSSGKAFIDSVEAQIAEESA